MPGALPGVAGLDVACYSRQTAFLLNCGRQAREIQGKDRTLVGRPVFKTGGGR